MLVVSSPLWASPSTEGQLVLARESGTLQAVRSHAPAGDASRSQEELSVVHPVTSAVFDKTVQVIRAIGF